MDRGQVELAVRFVLSNNRPGSVTRITTDTANVFVKRGIPTTVVVPRVDWLDFKLFQLSRSRFRDRIRYGARLLLEVLSSSVGRRQWRGLTGYGADPRIRVVWYWLTPPPSSGNGREVTVVQPVYVVPNLLRSMTDYRTKIITVVHNNYLREMQSPVPEQAAWKAHCVAIDQKLAVYRVAVSEQTKQAAEQLGIQVHRVVNWGVDTARFHPPERRTRRQSLKVLLSCALNPQKGQRIGVEALKQLKTAYGTKIRCESIGYVLPECVAFFDHNHGYLHGDAYVKAIQDSDIFVYPSLFDGFPAPPLEAMACGCAVVTTAVEGVTEYAVDGENCLVCHPGDPIALRERIARLIRGESLRQRLQTNASHSAQAYSIERAAERLFAFLKEVQQLPS